jgi:catechol 2,3-dioxygenase-like lactoylglutathione lyase family enzyme
VKFRLSNNIAIGTIKQPEAKKFYTEVLGFKDRTDEAGYEGLESGSFRVFIQHDEEVQGVVMELFVDDLEAAKDTLLSNGCRIIRWKGPGNDCYVEDPYGVRFNIWEEKK